MARKPGRYTEARLYMVGGAVAATTMVWAALAVRDTAPAPSTPATPATATSDAPAATGGTITSAPQATPQPVPQRRSSAQVVPHTRTRAS